MYKLHGIIDFVVNFLKNMVSWINQIQKGQGDKIALPYANQG